MRLVLSFILITTTIGVVSSEGLDCDFSTACCWATSDEHQNWDVRSEINVNEFRRTFLVGRSKPPPTGEYVMRIETGESGSAFQSCPFCSSGTTVNVTYRHWQSPTARLDLCYKYPSDEIDNSNCVQVHSTRQSQLVEQPITVPTGKSIQLFFLLDNTASETHAVTIIDKIKVKYSPCNGSSSTPEAVQYEYAKVKHTATYRPFVRSRTVMPTVHLPDKRRSEVEERTSAEHTESIPKVQETKRVKITLGQRELISVGQSETEREKGIQKLKIKKLSRKERILDAEIEKQIRNLDEDNEVYKIDATDSQFVRAKGVRNVGRPITIKPLTTVLQNHNPSNPVNERTSSEYSPIAVVPVPLPASQNPLPSTVATTNSPQKSFNPLYDLVGEEMSKFLDPNFVTSENDDFDDPDVEENHVNANKASKKGISAVARPRAPQPRYQVVRQSTTTPIGALGHPEVCHTVGGCLFERSFCGFSQPAGTTTGRFQLERVALSSFAQARIEPGESSVLETNTFMEKEHAIHFDVLEFSENSRILGCCSSDSDSRPLQCPFATPLEGGLVIWQKAKFNCPANTSKITFICENTGKTPTTCAIDNVSLYSLNDVILLEPCQKNVLSQL